MPPWGRRPCSPYSLRTPHAAWDTLVGYYSARRRTRVLLTAHTRSTPRVFYLLVLLGIVGVTDNTESAVVCQARRHTVAILFISQETAHECSPAHHPACSL